MSHYYIINGYCYIFAIETVNSDAKVGKISCNYQCILTIMNFYLLVKHLAIDINLEKTCFSLKNSINKFVK